MIIFLVNSRNVRRVTVKGQGERHLHLGKNLIHWVTYSKLAALRTIFLLINRVHAARQYSEGRQIGVDATSVAAERDLMEIHVLSALGLSRSPGRFINFRNS
jgi:hypothetical protein